MFANLKKKITSASLLPQVPFLFLYLLMFFFHLTYAVFNDDAFYIAARGFVDASVLHLVDMTVSGYKTWGTPFLSYFSVLFCIREPWLWQVLDSFFLSLLAIVISRIFTRNNHRIYNWIVVLLILVYPFRHMATAGWISTTVPYVWTLAFGVYSTLFIKKVWDGEEILWFEYPYYVFSLVYGASSPQMSLVLIFVYGLFTFLFIKNHKAKRFLLFQDTLLILSFLSLLLSPGTNSRFVTELRWFPNYLMLSLVDKIELGYSSTLSHFICQPDMIFFLFTLLLWVVVWHKHKEMTARIISAIPFACCLIFGVSTSPPIFGVIPAIRNAVPHGSYGAITVENYFTFSSYFPIFIFGIVAICIILSLYLAFSDARSWLSIYIMVVGFVSRMILAFSPTIWASSTRTFIFLYFAFIICILLLFQELIEKESRYTTILFCILLSISLLSYSSLYY